MARKRREQKDEERRDGDLYTAETGRKIVYAPRRTSSAPPDLPSPRPLPLTDPWKTSVARSIALDVRGISLKDQNLSLDMISGISLRCSPLAEEH
jgi:hypothetical protein